MALSKGKNIAVWIISVLLALAFLASGVPKLLGVPQTVEGFHRWGYPDWFRIVTGLVETGSALLLLIPRTAFVGASLLVATMIGAAYTHLTHNEAPFVVGPLVLLVLAAIVAVARRPAMLRKAAA